MSGRNVQVVEIGGEEFTVKELKNKHLDQLLKIASGMGNDTSLESFRGIVEKFLPRCVDGLSMEQFMELTPSQTRQLFEAAKEVNADFFALAQAAGLGEIAQGIRRMMVPAILSDFVKSLQGSSPEDT